MIIRRLWILLFPLLFSQYAEGEIIYTKSDSLIYDSYMRQFTSQKDKPMSELLINTAKFFLEKPYVASTLEVSDKEKLVVNLREFDCTTFVESCIALVLTLKSNDLSFENYCKELTSLRYRDGEINGYCSRLHYMTDWIYENENRNVIRNVSKDLGGKAVSKEINFMTKHSHLYKHLKNNSEHIKELRKIEVAIDSRNNYLVISDTQISNVEKGIKDGNIIIFATDIPGLDYSHIGIAYWQDGQLHFIHASSKAKKVVVEKKRLSEYCRSAKSCTGISVVGVNQN